MTDILQIYDLCAKGKRYCMICIRTEDERRLEDITNLKSLAKTIHLQLHSTKDSRICWWCSRLVSRARRLLTALTASAAAHRLLARMRGPRARNTLAGMLAAPPSQSGDSGLGRRAASWAKRLSAMRCGADLVSTDVLLVSMMPQETLPDDHPDAAVKSFQNAVKPRPGVVEPRPGVVEPPVAAVRPPVAVVEPPAPDESEEYLLPDDAPRSSTRQIQMPHEPEIYAPIKIEDDEQDPLSTAHPALVTVHDTPRPSQPAAPPQVEPTNNQMAANDDTCFILHPIVEKNGSLIVPTLNAQLINGQLVTIDNSNVIIQTPRVALRNGKGYKFITEPTDVAAFFQSSDRTESAKSLIVSNKIPLEIIRSNVDSMENTLRNQTANQNIEVTMQNNVLTAPVQNPVLTIPLQYNLLTNPVNIALINPVQNHIIATNNTQTLTPIDSERLNPIGGQLRKPLSENDVLIRSIIIDDDDDVMEVGSDEGKKKDDGRRKREGDRECDGPPSKQRETDWEDKIPMDVISYMDATDPNANSFLAKESPLGVISSVQSVTEEAHLALETNTEQDTNIGAQTGTRIGAQTGTRIGAQTGTKIGSRLGSNIGAKTRTSIGTQTRTSIGVQTGTSIGAQTGTNNGAQTGIGVSAPAGTSNGAQAATNIGAQAATNIGAQTRTNVKAITNFGINYIDEAISSNEIIRNNVPKTTPTESNSDEPIQSTPIDDDNDVVEFVIESVVSKTVLNNLSKIKKGANEGRVKKIQPKGKGMGVNKVQSGNSLQDGMPETDVATLGKVGLEGMPQNLLRRTRPIKDVVHGGRRLRVNRLKNKIVKNKIPIKDVIDLC